MPLAIRLSAVAPWVDRRFAAWRFLSLAFASTFMLMIAMHAKDYYVVPIYPVLFAAGGIAWERRLATHKAVAADRVFAFPILETALLATTAFVLPLAIPVLSPQTWIAYTHATHLDRINAGQPRLTVGAVNVRSGKMHYFDSRDMTITFKHVLASGALPRSTQASIAESVSN